MAKIYFDADADLSRLNGRKIAIIGYGNQGRAQALNMRDSGIGPICVGSIKDTAHHTAKQDGFQVLSIDQACKQADIIFMLVPDEVMPDIYKKEVEPYLKKGDVLNFASGYNITFNFIVPPAFVDVIMVAPRMIGDGVRNLFLTRAGYQAFIAVQQDASGKAQQTALALAKAIGATIKGALEVNFRDETMLDLLAEQAIWPLIISVLTEAFAFEVEKGHPAEASVIELYLCKEPAYMFEKMAELGLYGQFPFHSHTSQYGQLSRFEKLDKTFIRNTLRQAYDHIDSGKFAQEWKEEQANGLPNFQRLKEKALNSEICKIEKTLLTGHESPDAAHTWKLQQRVLTEQLVMQALHKGIKVIELPENGMATALAKEAAQARQIVIKRKSE
jgi:ketol-acid reductoisomerase